MKDYITPRQKCPHCGKRIDRALGKEEHQPAPGDVSICLGCLGVIKFGEDLKVSKAEPGDWADVADEVFELRKLITNMKRGLAAPFN